MCNAVKPPLLFLVPVLCVLSCERPADDAPTLAARTQIGCFKTGLSVFQADCGRLPSTAEGLAALITRPVNVPESQWHGPYAKDIPKDPWGHGYVYRCPSLHDTNSFDIYSCGPDGVSKSSGDDKDDISSWPKETFLR